MALNAASLVVLIFDVQTELSRDLVTALASAAFGPGVSHGACGLWRHDDSLTKDRAGEQTVGRLGRGLLELRVAVRSRLLRPPKAPARP